MNTCEPEEPAFLDDEGPSAELPAFISTTNAGKLYGLRPGETVAEAIARHHAQQEKGEHSPLGIG